MGIETQVNCFPGAGWGAFASHCNAGRGHGTGIRALQGEDVANMQGLMLELLIWSAKIATIAFFASSWCVLRQQFGGSQTCASLPCTGHPRCLFVGAV